MSLESQASSTSVDLEGSVSSGLSGRKQITSRYRWNSNIAFIMTAIIYSLNIFIYKNVEMIEENSPNLLQYLTAIIVTGMPVEYMQVALGQYTQLSGTYLKCLSPIAHGLGYAFIFSATLRLIPNGAITGDYLLYFLNSFNPNLPWMKCKEEHKTICWSGTCNLENGCVNQNVSPSAYIYWNYTYMGEIPEVGTLSNFDVRRLMTVLVVWVAIYIILLNTKSLARKYVRYIFAIAFILILINIVVLIIMNTKSLVGFKYMLLFDLNVEKMISLSIWVKAQNDILVIMSIGKGGHILLGSYLAPTAPSGILTVLGVIFYVLIIYFFELILHISFAFVADKAKIPNNYFNISRHKYEILELTVIPNAIGYGNIPQLWSVLYYTSCILFSTIFLIINAKVIETCFEDVFVNYFKYRKYVLFLFLIFCALLSLLYICDGLFIFTSHHFLKSINIFDAFSTFVFTAIVSWVYGVQRLCDDIHFNLGSQPTKFWKITWFFAPIFTGFGSIFQFYEINQRESKEKIFIGVIFAILFSPVLIMAIIEAFKYMKKRNLLGLIQPEERWGPPDPQDRYLRQVFNPRKEVRSRRRNEVCQHKCLLGSQVLKKIVHEESKYFHYHDQLYNMELKTVESTEQID